MYLVVTHKRLAVRPIQEWLPHSKDNIIVIMPESQIQKNDKSYFFDLISVKDYKSKQVESIIYEIAKKYNVKRIIGTAEIDVLRCSRVRSKLSIEGMSLELATKYTDKYYMWEAVSSKGLNISDTIIIDSLERLIRFGKKHKYLIIIKPRNGFGSYDITKIENSNQILKWWNISSSKSTHYIAQAYNNNKLYHVDGIVKSKQVFHSWPSVYNTGGLQSLVQKTAHSSHLLQKDDFRVEILQNFAKNIINCFNNDNNIFAFHLEVFLSSQGIPSLCEVACRPAGGVATEAYEEAFDLSLFYEHVMGQYGIATNNNIPCSFPKIYSGWILLQPKGYRLTNITTFPYQKHVIKIGLPDIGDTFISKEITDTAGVIALKDSSAEKVSTLLKKIENWWLNSTKWVL